ncbi:MAG: amidohydrolase family protein [Pollutimonas bauzanensis]|uniref:Predicted metal-dependent hydrolase, TIM-barrel fold n=1 Tax=Pollutimonas bauzanensis TaxID=658167 RepID=A0A1M5ZJH3_9BURK|nr:amidohydrolase family protein [Pollutimonas bauzanensis]SHI24390.1 Predicted metal-dependent hydrolase, TIM-barrel fold [Pollutimonas bauzanensis]
MHIIDAHFHLWDLQENYYPWLNDGDRSSVVPNYSSLRRNYLISDFLRDATGMELLAAVHIQAEHDPRDHVRETRWLQGVADMPGACGFPQAIVANVDLAAHDAREVLEGHMAYRNMRGLRQALHRRLGEPLPYDPLLDPVWQRNFHLLRDFDLSFDLQFFPEQGEGVVDLVRAHPDVQFILTHVGMPYMQEAERHALWRRNMIALSSMPNIAVKISGFGMFDSAWTSESIRPLMDFVLERFQPERCLLASNYPVEGIVKPYHEIWAAYARCFADLSQNEQAALFRENARRLYRLKGVDES